MPMGPPRWIPWVFMGVAVILFAVAAGFELNNLRYRDAETATGGAQEARAAVSAAPDPTSALRLLSLLMGAPRGRSASTGRRGGGSGAPRR